MTFQRMGLTFLGVMVLGVMGCPEPTKKANPKNGGSGGSTSAMGGSTGSGGRVGSGGSGGSSSGSGGSGGSSSNGGSGGSSSGSGGRDAGSSSMGGSAGRDAGSSMAGHDGGSAAGGRDGGAGGRDGGAAAGNKVPAAVATVLRKCGTTCHGGEYADAAKAYTRLMGTASSGACNGMKRITVNDGAGSLVVKKVGAAAPPCGARMPQNCSGATCLTDAEIKTLSDWITAGAKPE